MLLKNVRLETALKKVNEQILTTETAIFDLRIEKGRIIEIKTHIAPANQEIVYDVEGNLLVPSMREMHIHIDKTYFGGEWKACRPIINGIQTRIDEEKWLLPSQEATSYQRAEAMIKHYLSQGHNHIRTHVNIDPIMKTRHLAMVVELLKKYEDVLTYEIVAFPQHGLLKSDVAGLIREALAMGATHVGGVDPSLVDRHVDRSLQQIFDLASEQNKKIDLHLHARNSLGLYEFEKIIAYTKQYQYQGKVTLSHAMALGDLNATDLESIAKKFAETNIDLTTTIPIRNTTMPILALEKAGVGVSLGHDSLTDHWSPFGSGNTIEKLNTVAQRFSISDEYRLSRLLGFATNQLMPLDSQGIQQWPRLGDKADFFTVNAQSTAHMIARNLPIEQVFANGKLIATRGEVDDSISK